MMRSSATEAAAFDTVGEYRRYAESVVRAEMGQAPRPRRVVLFSPTYSREPAAHMVQEHLIQPLRQYLSEQHLDWQTLLFSPEEATKKRLGELLGGPATPALLFVASHGMAFPISDPRQLPQQGALLCQDWPGPINWGNKPITPEFYFTAADVDETADLLGTVMFFWAAYSVGTPSRTLDMNTGSYEREVAPQPFVAHLPQRLLSHPAGGALAVLGMTDLNWSLSYLEDRNTSNPSNFINTMRLLVQGYPVGLAMEYFNQRYAELLADLQGAARESDGRDFDRELAHLRLVVHDARNYAMVGDPAVRLSTAPW
jgi:hypothetical protein